LEIAMNKNLEPVQRRALGIVEAARAMGVSRSSVYRLLTSGKLESVKLGSRRLVRVEALEKLLGEGALK
jgi:excisionase family DNA binding protein